MPAFNLLIIDLKIPIHHQDEPHNLYFQNAKCSLGIYFLANNDGCWILKGTLFTSKYATSQRRVDQLQNVFFFAKDV